MHSVQEKQVWNEIGEDTHADQSQIVQCQENRVAAHNCDRVDQGADQELGGKTRYEFHCARAERVRLSV